MSGYPQENQRGIILVNLEWYLGKFLSRDSLREKTGALGRHCYSLSGKRCCSILRDNKKRLRAKCKVRITVNSWRKIVKGIITLRANETEKPREVGNKLVSARVYAITNFNMLNLVSCHLNIIINPPHLNTPLLRVITDVVLYIIYIIVLTHFVFF